MVKERVLHSRKKGGEEMNKIIKRAENNNTIDKDADSKIIFLVRMHTKKGLLHNAVSK